VCDKVVVECSSLGYGRAGPEEGFIEKYSQSFGDAERAAGVFHCVVGIAEGKVMIGLDRHGEVGAGVSRRAHPSSETSVKWLMVGKMVNDVPVGFHEPFPRRTTSLPSCVLYINQACLYNTLNYRKRASQRTHPKPWLSCSNKGFTICLFMSSPDITTRSYGNGINVPISAETCHIWIEVTPVIYSDI
jgi:hypothetical protein